MESFVVTWLRWDGSDREIYYIHKCSWYLWRGYWTLIMKAYELGLVLGFKCGANLFTDDSLLFLKQQENIVLWYVWCWMFMHELQGISLILQNQLCVRAYWWVVRSVRDGLLFWVSVWWIFFFRVLFIFSHTWFTMSVKRTLFFLPMSFMEDGITIEG